MKNQYIQYISGLLGIKDWQVENCAALIEEGATIPFISRYRKERTGGLDDEQVAEIQHWTDTFAEMEKRKETILATIESLGKLTPELREEIESCVSSTALEDLYLPFRPKRRTRATAAKEAGLGPLADAIYNHSTRDPYREAAKYTGDKVPDAEAALSGARDIIAERISDSAIAREALRTIFRTKRLTSKVTKAGTTSQDAQKFRTYFDYSEPLSRMASHRLLAILRGVSEGWLSVKIDADAEKCGNKLYYDYCQQVGYPQPETGKQMRAAIDDAYKRLLEPSISTEILKEYKAKADKESISVFGENLRQLLLAPPVGQKRTMAIDPGFRNGCKIVCLDEHGALLHHEIIYPHPPLNQKIKAISALSRMIDEFSIEAIAIGNGTASRETEDFVKRIHLPENCKVYMVSESGASIYSASEVARQEFPDEDVTVRGAVSIGRRLMDPLSELVKIDPKSIGVGQYQYDVDQTLLKEKLDNTVTICVNSVGVDLNTASPYLLAYVSGIGPSLAGAIIKYRTDNGGFHSRQELLKVPRLGAKAFEQAAGFLRIRGGSNPLDNSAVHPESYHIVDRMATDLGIPASSLAGNATLCAKIDPEKYIEEDFGLPTVRDILKELAKPGRDPRESATEFSFAEDIHDIEDLSEGMEIPGIVTNITDFGAFVDIGIHENGLIHISKMGEGNKGKIPLKLHQHIKVQVIGVDLDRRRISLKLIS